MLANEAIGILHYTFRIVALEYFEVSGLKDSARRCKWQELLAGGRMRGNHHRLRIAIEDSAIGLLCGITCSAVAAVTVSVCFPLHKLVTHSTGSTT
jgi:hypothetical protein